MKKQYLKISLAAFFFAALIFGTSCSKKSSDPTPATTAPPSATSEKPNAPDIDKRTNKTVDAEDGTGRPPLIDIPVGAVTVKDQASQRNDGMIPENQAKLDNLTGKGATQGRFEANSTTTVFGWFIADYTLDGYSYTDKQIYENGLQQAIFFNIDSSGYYWAFDNKSKTWSWGTYGIDNAMTTLAIDFDSLWVPTETYKIAKITKDRMVLTLQFQDDKGGSHNAVIGLNGYDLSSNKYNGDMKTSPAEKVYLGKWTNLDANSLPASPLTNLFLNVDGTYSLEKVGEATSYGSWVLEEDLDNVYLYASYYDAKLNNNEGGVAVDLYQITIVNNVMDMLLVDTSNPENEIYINYTYKFGR